jgi:hypothetical protein
MLSRYGRQFLEYKTQMEVFVTSKQFIALLDELCTIGCCERRTRQGEQIYVISLSQIYEADFALSDTGCSFVKSGSA